MEHAQEVDIIIASDPDRLPDLSNHEYGRASSSLYPIRIPSPWRFLEALIMLLKRDVHTRFRGFWMSQIVYMIEYVDGKGCVLEEMLEPQQKKFYQSVKSGPPAECWDLL